MTDTPQPPAASPKASPKKPYHAPDLRDYGTVKELTLTGGTPGGPIDGQLAPDYATGSVN